jgi:PIN domain nuclease of toxin-antitoxin system
MTDIHGESVDAKVAWVSPLTARRLLVNRRGLRVLVASAEELASLHAAGRLQLGCEPTAFEQAMRQVRQQLDRAVGQH